MGKITLNETHPELAEEWHPTKNGNITPDKITFGSKRKFWWLGKCGHEWLMNPLSRKYGQGCAVCSGKQTQAGINDLKTLYPDLVPYWHPTKNGDKVPDDLVSVSKKNYWLLECKHEKFVSAKIFASHRKCLICTNQALVRGVNDLRTLNPDVAKLWHPSKNNKLLPDDVLSTSKEKVWWSGECGHEWLASPKAMLASKTVCPFCGKRELLVGFNDLGTLYPEVNNYWDINKNEITPQDVLPGSHVKVWIKGECGHEWEKEVRRIFPIKCPFCSVGGRLLVGFNDLGTVNPELAKQWHPLLNVQTFRGKSDYKGWWLGECGHEWQATVNDRQRGFGCPYCASQKVLQGFNDLATRNPDLASEWDYDLNQQNTPEKISPGSNQKVWWKCNFNHSYLNSPGARTRGRGCPECAANSYSSKAETEVYEFIKKDLGFSTAKQNDRAVIRGELDIHIPEKNIAIEFNGLYWHNEQAGRDKYYHHDKWKACKDKGIQLIQIWEDEYKRNPEQVKSMLAHKLGVTTQRKVFARKTDIVQFNAEQANLFLNENHIQGAVDGGIRLGLIEKGVPGTVLAVMVLKREPGTNSKTLNLLRFATSANVVGGFTKILNHVEKEYTPESIITFSDNCVSDGGLYLNNGFTAVKELAPDYKYVVKGERVHKFQYRLKRFREDPNLLFEEGLSEKELATLNNLPRIWDAGKVKWVKKLVNEA